jgi:beta-fructofuranosidase
MSVFYRPDDGFVGDVVPFYWKGLYHAFYLKAALPPARKAADGTPYAHLVSNDLAHWEERPLVVEPGAPGEPDCLGCWTGSVIERNGVFHLFYTGHSGPGKPQTICHATSGDLHTWEKDPQNPVLRADPRWYEPADWRDPFLFWNEEAGEYWMLLAARVKDGPSNRRGCTALAASPDLQHWKVRPPFWSPWLYHTHECPDLFRWGDQWMLVFSEFSDRTVTHYRMSESLNGPWVAPANDTFDGRAFYAAKTASDGVRRFVFGWNPSREGEADTGKWEWGGNMVVHELERQGDGSIGVSAIPEVEALFKQSHPLPFQAFLGEWGIQGTSIRAKCADGFAASALGEMRDCCRIGLTISCSPGTRACGILLRAQPGLEGYYQVRWEPERRRVVFDRYPRPGDEPFMLERPVETAAGEPIELKVLTEGTVVVAYINDTVALSCRAYEHRSGQLGLFVVEGGATFSEISIRS